MVDAAMVQWVGTVIFAITGLCYLRDLVLRRGAPVDDTLHVLLSAGMIVLLWPWGMVVPTMVYVLVFTGAALWFVARALRIVAAGPGGAADPSARHGSGSVAWYHAAMMAAMVWLAVVMGVAMTTLSPATATTSATAAIAMSGMDMAAIGPGAGPTAPTALAGGTALAWVAGPCLVLAAEFLIAAVWQAAVALRDGRRHAVLAGGVGTVLAGGMALVFVALA